MSARRALFVATFVALLQGCGPQAQGSFHAQGARTGTWDLVPDRCVSGFHHGFLGAELHRQDEREDTQLVLVARPEGSFVLARVPGADEMIVYRREDCRVFEADVHTNGVKINHVPSVSGSLALDCDKAGFGALRGRVAFTCY